MLTKNVVKGHTYKVVIFKSDKIINVGNHSCITENIKIHNSISNKVYHFKWIYNLIHRIKTNKTRKIFHGHEWSSHEISNVESARIIPVTPPVTKEETKPTENNIAGVY